MTINFKRQPDYKCDNGEIMKVWQVESAGKPIKNEIGELMIITGYPETGYWQHNYGDDDTVFDNFAQVKSALIADLGGAK